MVPRHGLFRADQGVPAGECAVEAAFQTGQAHVHGYYVPSHYPDPRVNGMGGQGRQGNGEKLSSNFPLYP